MNIKGYVFCAVAVLLGFVGWLHSVKPAAAADAPTHYEYMMVATPQTTDMAAYNKLGAQGWKAVGLSCLPYNYGAVGNGGPPGFVCAPQTLFERPLQ